MPEPWIRYVASPPGPGEPTERLARYLDDLRARGMAVFPLAAIPPGVIDAETITALHRGMTRALMRQAAIERRQE